jgi:hypothetical protein
MHKRLGPDDPLYKFLSDLPGLNLYTGDGGLTMDFDYKHLFTCMFDVAHMHLYLC